jgi:hypothetical protein
MRIVSLLFLTWLALATWGVGSTLAREANRPGWLQPVESVWT